MSETYIAVNTSKTRTVFYRGGNASIGPRNSVEVTAAEMASLMEQALPHLEIESTDPLISVLVATEGMPLSDAQVAELSKVGVNTLSELTSMSDDDKVEIPRIGDATVGHLCDWLSEAPY